MALLLKLDSSFELAFRRALFSLLLLLAYLLITSLLLCLIGQIELAKLRAEMARDPRELQRSRRMDFERTELLNTLWAEAVAARSESDWSLLANTKLDAYERLLASESVNLCTGQSAVVVDPSPWTFSSTFRSSILAVTTMGGGPLTDMAPAEHGPFTKLFTALFAILGIPLALIHIGHSVKAVNALIGANFRSATLGLLALFSGVVLLSAIVVDIALVEDEEDELKSSFLDSLFVVLLALTTICGRSLHQLSPFLLVPLSIAMLSVSGAIFGTMQRSIERWMAPHEFAFANGICGKIERAVSGERLDEADEEEEEAPETERTVKLRFGGTSGPDRNGSGTESSNPDGEMRNLLMPPGRNIVGETIREESEHSSNVGDDEDEEGGERMRMMPEAEESG